MLAPKRSYEKAGLKLWTRYNVHVAASTSVGRGPFSSVVKVQTDEDSKYFALNRNLLSLIFFLLALCSKVLL